MARTGTGDTGGQGAGKAKLSKGGLIKNLAAGKPAKASPKLGKVAKLQGASKPGVGGPKLSKPKLAGARGGKVSNPSQPKATAKAPAKSAAKPAVKAVAAKAEKAPTRANEKTRRQMRLLLLLLGAGRMGVDINEIFKIDEYWPADLPASKRDPYNRKGDYDTSSAHAVKLQRDVRDLISSGLAIVDATPNTGDRKQYRLDIESSFGHQIEFEEEEQVLLSRLYDEAGSVFPEPLAKSLRSAVYKLCLGVMEPPSLKPSKRPQLRQSGPATQIGAHGVEKIVDAMAGGHSLRFKYRGSNDAVSRLRHVAPYTILPRGRIVYLIGRDLQDKQGTIKVFRLNRIDGEPTVIKSSKDHFPPVGFDPTNHLSPDPVTTTVARALASVTIDFDQEVGFIILNWADGRRGASVKELSDGRVRLTIQQASPSGLVAMLAEYAGHFKIREPEAAQALDRLMEETLKPYRG